VVADQYADAEAEVLLYCLGQLGRQGVLVTAVGGEDGVAALEIRLYVAVAEFRDQRAELGHRHLLVAAHVDPAQQRRVCRRHPHTIGRPSGQGGPTPAPRSRSTAAP
jgi:hypothetical protein